MNSRVARAFATTGAIAAMLTSMACTSASVLPDRTYDAAALASIARTRAASLLEQPGPCRDWFVSRGHLDPANSLRRVKLRIFHLTKGFVAGTPNGQSEVILIDPLTFGGLSVEGATLVIIHEFAHITTPELDKEEAESVAIYVEGLCFGRRGDMWEVDAWNKGAADG